MDDTSGNEIVSINNESKGLDPNQKRMSAEDMLRIFQGKGTEADHKFLSWFSERDPHLFVTELLNAGILHPSFNDPDMIMDNIHKQAMLRLKQIDIKNKSKLQHAQTQSISAKAINQMLRLNHPEDGKRFGLMGSEVIENNSEPEYDKNESVIDNDD